MDWFVARELSLNSADVVLEEGEQRHLGTVLRATAGTPIVAFDGRGQFATCVVSRVDRRKVTVERTAEVQRQSLPQPQWGLFSAAPKGDRLSWLVEKVTELGLNRLSFLDSARSVVKAGESKLERLQATALAACKQSRRAHLPAISPRLWSPSELLAAGPPPGTRWVVLDQGGRSVSDVLGRWLAINDGGDLTGADGIVTEVAAWVGPEGGWDDRERAAFEAAGLPMVSLGDAVLRVETAAVAWAAIAGELRLHRRERQ